MKLKFLGTGAADWPDPGAHVGSGRRVTSMVVNDWLMIDCGSMTLEAVDEFQVDVEALREVVISHPHDDHFDMGQLCELARRRSGHLPPLRVTVHSKALERSAVPSELSSRLVLAGYEPDMEFERGGVVFHSLPANHELDVPGEKGSHLYMTFPNGETLFYALDGAYFLPDTWRFLQWHRMDVIIWELTCGSLADWRLFAHCNLGVVRVMADAFRADGSIHDGTVMFCSHLARKLCPPQEIYARELKTCGFILAFDGLEWDNGR